MADALSNTKLSSCLYSSGSMDVAFICASSSISSDMGFPSETAAAILRSAKLYDARSKSPMNVSFITSSRFMEPLKFTTSINTSHNDLAYIPTFLFGSNTYM